MITYGKAVLYLRIRQRIWKIWFHTQVPQQDRMVFTYNIKLQKTLSQKKLVRDFYFKFQLLGQKRSIENKI